MNVVFEVEQAGCESCGKLIAAALGQVATVASIAIDEDRDTATVVLSGRVSRRVVETTVEQASAGGHGYRVRASSWRPLEQTGT